MDHNNTPEIIYDKKRDLISNEMYENKRYIPNVKMTWYNTPKKIKNFIIENMLCINPEERLQALELLSLYEQIL